MTINALEKIKGTKHEELLETQRRYRRSMAEQHRDREEKEVKTFIAGYLKALHNSGIITDRERMKLYIYYATC